MSPGLRWQWMPRRLRAGLRLGSLRLWPSGPKPSMDSRCQTPRPKMQRDALPGRKRPHPQDLDRERGRIPHRGLRYRSSPQARPRLSPGRGWCVQLRSALPGNAPDVVEPRCLVTGQAKALAQNPLELSLGQADRGWRVSRCLTGSGSGSDCGDDAACSEGRGDGCSVGSPS
jgi:hypothetical protein